MFPPLYAPRPQGSSRSGTRTQAWIPRDPHHASSLVVSPGEMDLPITHTGIVLGRMLFNVLFGGKQARVHSLSVN